MDAACLSRDVVVNVVQIKRRGWVDVEVVVSPSICEVVEWFVEMILDVICRVPIPIKKDVRGTFYSPFLFSEVQIKEAVEDFDSEAVGKEMWVDVVGSDGGTSPLGFQLP